MVMGSGGLNLQPKEIETLVGKFYNPNHGNGDEFLDYEEFMSLIHQVRFSHKHHPIRLTHTNLPTYHTLFPTQYADKVIRS